MASGAPGQPGAVVSWDSNLHSSYWSSWGLVSSGLLSHEGITLVNWRDPDGAKHSNPLLVCGVVWATTLPWEETEAITVVLIRFLPGKNSKWAISVIQDTSAVAPWHGPNIDYMHSPRMLSCLNHVFCRCWHNFPSWDLFSFTRSYKGPCGRQVARINFCLKYDSKNKTKKLVKKWKKSSLAFFPFNRCGFFWKIYTYVIRPNFGS